MLDTGEKVKHKLSDDGVISFRTEVNGKYLILRPDTEISVEQTFTGEPNTGPKYFNEAILGSKRDF